MLSGRRRTSTHTKQVSQVRARLSQRPLEVAFGVVLVAGNAWWLTSSDGSGTYYFYGHLSDFAPVSAWGPA